MNEKRLLLNSYCLDGCVGGSGAKQRVGSPVCLYISQKKVFSNSMMMVNWSEKSLTDDEKNIRAVVSWHIRGKEGGTACACVCIHLHTYCLYTSVVRGLFV